MKFVLIHGAATDSRVWDEPARALRAAGNDVLAPDRPQSGDLDTEVAFLAPMCVDAMVVGVSGGATLGLEVAARGIRLRGALLHEPAAGSLAPGLLSHVAEGLERDGVRGFGKALYGDGRNTSFTRATEATVRREFAMFGAFEPAPLSVAPQSISITVGSASPPSRFASTQALAAFLGARWSVLDGTGHAAHLDNALTPAAIERLTGSASEPLSHQPSQ